MKLSLKLILLFCVLWLWPCVVLSASPPKIYRIETAPTELCIITGHKDLERKCFNLLDPLDSLVFQYVMQIMSDDGWKYEK
jgi:hypothetical protein